MTLIYCVILMIFKNIFFYFSPSLLRRKKQNPEREKSFVGKKHEFDIHIEIHVCFFCLVPRFRLRLKLKNLKVFSGFCFKKKTECNFFVVMNNISKNKRTNDEDRKVQ